MKTCSKCKEEKDESLFYKLKTGKDGKHPYCIKCFREKSKQYYIENKVIILDKVNKWTKDNRQRRVTIQTKYAHKNREKLADIQLKYSTNKVYGGIAPKELVETVILINKIKRLCKTLNN